MAPPKRKAGGRVTPKGTRPGQSTLPTAADRIGESLNAASDDEGPRHASSASTRYTPPGAVIAAKGLAPSPRWLAILMFALWIVGALVIICYYLGWVPGGADARSQWYLFGGLMLILGGLYAATKYR